MRQVALGQPLPHIRRQQQRLLRQVGAECRRHRVLPSSARPQLSHQFLRRRLLADQTVLVSGGSIIGVGHRDDVPVPETFTAIDGTGKYLMPGLADMHVHLEYFDDPGVLDLFLANGVTTVRNMDGRPYILEWRDRIARGEWRGPTIHTAGPILDGDPPLRDDNLAIGTADDAGRAVGDQASAGYDFLKVYTNLSAEGYAAVLEAAEARGLPVAGHVPRGVDVEEFLVSGIRSIEHVTELGDLVEGGGFAVPQRMALVEAVPGNAGRPGQVRLRRRPSGRFWGVGRPDHGAG